MIVGIANIKLKFFTPHSLKEKRQIVKSLISKIMQHNVSVAEVGENDKWQLCELGIAAVGSDKKIVDSTFNSILKQIEQDGRAEIIDINIEIL
ncbi:hypothetical protein SAMN05660865_00377 [Caloramator fervidus]|uniref:YlxP-like protein n=1 Tax=Caloramator fervidus TaxID=29344 RepID=A0A1H5SLP5_9CLOT|nr:DUF503 domain-containing protein [Caloramator fervidus]SEF50771.1 hypothetical protein SAMN05660865_00377 [Caloramator fervidus]